jgi:hypothetical protein
MEPPLKGTGQNFCILSIDEEYINLHFSGSKHAKAVLLSKTKFNPSGIVSEIKTESPTQVEKIETVSSPPPITVTLPRLVN